MGDRQREITIGGLYVVRHKDGIYGIYQVLAIDEIAVNLRKYSNRFESFPTRIDPDSLTTGMDLEALMRGEMGAIGIGHLPLAREGFWAMEPVLLQIEPIADDELNGYRVWLEGDSSEEEPE